MNLGQHRASCGVLAKLEAQKRAERAIEISPERRLAKKPPSAGSTKERRFLRPGGPH
jgi:hypothetical protein